MVPISKSEAKAKELKKYFTGIPCKRGHTSERYTLNSDCVECSIERAMGVHAGKPLSEVYENRRRRRSEKIEKYRAAEAAYRQKNPERGREHSKKYYRNNKDKCAEKRKKWFADNRDKAREKWRSYSTERRSTTEGRLLSGLRARISVILSSGESSNSAVEYLGCSIEAFKEHLESKFVDGMSWDNYGLYGWHIDHIRPISSFDTTKDEEIRRALHYTNTQPMWAKDNLKKAASWPV